MSLPREQGTICRMRGDPDAYALSYDTGLRTLDQQVSTIAETRDRAGKLLTVATVAVSLFLVAMQTYRDEINNIKTLGYIGTVLAITGTPRSRWYHTVHLETGQPSTRP